MLNDRDEEILEAVHRYRYMTALDICYLLFSPISITHVREILKELSGNNDNTATQYLYRFAMPKAKTGNLERIYAVGSRGRTVLLNKGSPRGYFRPYTLDTLSYSHLLHALALTRVCVSATYFAKQQAPDVRILTLLSYHYETPPTPAVIPDAFILFGLYQDKFPMLVEIDCGTEGQRQFKKGVANRSEYVRNGDYRRAFYQDAVNICYIVIAESERQRQVRRTTLMRWTMEVLEEQNRQSWGRVFRFAESGLKEMYSLDLFQKPVWYLPRREKPTYVFGE